MEGQFSLLMNLKPKLTNPLIAASIALLAGVINYFLFRPHILFFDWLQIEPATPIVINSNFVLYFLRGYFSDITWCVSLCLIIVALDRQICLSKYDKAFLLLVPFISEIAQYFSLFPGTFDWVDMLLYTVIILLLNIIFSFSIIPLNMQKIKSHFFTLGVSVLFLFMAFACSTTKPVVDTRWSGQKSKQNIVGEKENIVGEKDDADEASIKADQANVDFSVEVNKKYDLLQAWKLTTQIVTDYFDDIEVSDRETSYLRTAWSARSFQQKTIRSRLIIKLGNSDPLTFKIKLVSEYSKIPGTSVKSDEQFVEWDRILRRYQNIIGDFSARLGNK